MHLSIRRRWIRLVGAICLLASSSLFAGCKGDGALSEQEVKQMKSGPPAQMPPEAQAAFQKAMQSPQPAPPAQNGR
jgi:hypothetical protein